MTKTIEQKAKANVYMKEYKKRPKVKAYYQQYHKDYETKTYITKAANRLLKGAKDRSRIYGYDFNIELSDIIFPEFCPVLGIPLDWKGSRDFKPSIDRIDNSKGYVKGNILVVSARVNRIKSDASFTELKSLGEFYSQYITHD